jgi:hypothetical protein
MRWVVVEMPTLLPTAGRTRIATGLPCSRGSCGNADPFIVSNRVWTHSRGLGQSRLSRFKLPELFSLDALALTVRLRLGYSEESSGLQARRSRLRLWPEARRFWLQ